MAEPDFVYSWRILSCHSASSSGMEDHGRKAIALPADSGESERGRILGCGIKQPKSQNSTASNNILTTMPAKSWEQTIQKLVDMAAKPNWKEASKYAETATTLYNACFEVWIAARKHATRTVTVTSIMYMTVWNELLWAFISAMTGAYLDAIRTFRFVFEYAVQSWVLEEKYIDMPDSVAKIGTVLEDNESKHFKSILIKQLQFLSASEIESAIDIYHRLSEFVHPHSKILRTFPAESLVTFDMDPKLLELCAKFAVEVSDMLAVILVQRYPALQDEREFEEIVRDLGLKLTSNRLALRRHMQSS